MTEGIVRKLRALVVRPETADRVVSGPYDAYSVVERRSIRALEPLNYLNVTRTPEDLNEGETEADLVAHAREAVARIVDAGVYRHIDEPSLFLYELSYKEHVQLGIVGLVPVDAFADGRILKHEDYRPERALLLANHLRETGGTSSPISLSFRSWSAIEETLAELALSPPLLEHRRGDIGQRVWAVSGEVADGLAAEFADTTLYVTDGHHRVAAATMARQMADDVGGETAAAAAGPDLDWALAVIFPDRQLRVLAFHRLVLDRAERPVEQLLNELATLGLVASETASVDEARPRHCGEVGMYIGGRWFALRLAPAVGVRAVDRLDVQRFQAQVLEPLFGIRHAVSESNLSYVPAAAGLAEFVERCHNTEHTVGFLLYRTGIDELFAVADEGDLMPPKSSYFAPKPLSGVFLRSLNRGALTRFGSSVG